MSNPFLFTLLGCVFLILLGYAAWLIQTGYASMLLGFILCPALIVLSLMVGIGCGLRRPKPLDSDDDTPLSP
jgi:hypothetical protein